VCEPLHSHREYNPQISLYSFSPLSLLGLLIDSKAHSSQIQYLVPEFSRALHVMSDSHHVVSESQTTGMSTGAISAARPHQRGRPVKLWIQEAVCEATGLCKYCHKPTPKKNTTKIKMVSRRQKMRQPEADVTRQRYAWTQHLLNPVNCTYLFSSDAHANSDPVSRGSEIHATPCQGESLLCLSMTEERPHAIVRFLHAYMSAWPGIPGYNTMNICCLTATVHDCTHGFYMHTSVSAMGYLMIHSVLTLPYQ